MPSQLCENHQKVDKVGLKIKIIKRKIIREKGDRIDEVWKIISNESKLKVNNSIGICALY